MNSEGAVLIKGKKIYYDLLAVSDYVDDLIKYCEQCYVEYKKKTAEDEARNEQFRIGYQNFTHKESYSAKFNITVFDSKINYINFDSFNAYNSAATNRTFTALTRLDIELNISFRSGKDTELKDHERSFEIHFSPNDSFLAYESSEYDENFEAIRQVLERKLSQFPAIRTIFSPSEG